MTAIKKYIKKMSIRSYILSIILVFFIMVCVVIIIAFNLLVENYIRSNVQLILSEAARLPAINGPPEEEGQATAKIIVQDNYPNMGEVPPSRLGIKTLGFLLDEKYNVIINLRNNGVEDNKDANQSIAQIMKENGVNLNDKNLNSIIANSSKYYFTIHRVSTNTGDAYLVFYVDATSIKYFSANINLLLILIIGIVVLISVIVTIFISGYIARPIRELSSYALRIGHGNFHKSEAEYLGRELQELNDSMNSMVSKLETYDKEQKVFFQNVSHELRTPLMSIKCYAEGIEYGVMEAKGASETILKESDRLDELIESLLYISRIDNVTNNYEERRCDLRELLSSCAERQRGIAQSGGISIVYEFDERPVMFTCADKFMTRAFSNLISNAIRFAESEIKLICKNNGKNVVVAVCDDGCGIAEEDLPHIFDRFYKGAGGKHGIGLSIAKTVFEQYNGDLIAQNTTKGANFQVLLPIK